MVSLVPKLTTTSLDNKLKDNKVAGLSPVQDDILHSTSQSQHRLVTMITSS